MALGARGANECDEADDLPAFAAWRSQYVPPLDEVSYLATHLEVTSAAETDSEAEERALVRIAERMAVSWKLHARNQFPDREFEAEVTDDYGPTVALWSTSRRRHTAPDRASAEVA